MREQKHKSRGACTDRGEDICADCLGMARDSGREKGLEEAASICDDASDIEVEPLDGQDSRGAAVIGEVVLKTTAMLADCIRALRAKERP